MVETILFCLVFSSQVLSISWLYARRIRGRERYVLEHFPPSTHPRLYSQPLEYYERRLRAFGRLNGALVMLGFAIVVWLLSTLVSDSQAASFTQRQRENWNDFVVVPFFILQVLACVSLDLSRLKHHRALAKAPPPRVRTTELRRRRLTDFVSPGMLAAAALTNAAFVAFVLYYRRFGFTWFTAAGNIAGVAALALLFTVLVAVALRAPKADPYQTQRDRYGSIRRLVQQALAICIAFPLLISATLIAKLFDPEALAPVITSLFCQGCALAMLWPSYTQRVDELDFDVYRPDASTAS